MQMPFSSSDSITFAASVYRYVYRYMLVYVFMYLQIFGS